ncbi:MAG TPA: hypothetical protein VI702_01180 [Nitrospiria bacterium]
MPKIPAFMLAGLLLASAALAGCMIQPNRKAARHTIFVGVDASGSFMRSGHYDDSIKFLSHYLYGHLNELGELDKPRELFVGSIGGRTVSEPKAFHPIHDFEGKSVSEIETALRQWFPPTDDLTDFNAFFQQVARIAKERNLVLSPITVMVVTDGVPDVTIHGGSTNHPAKLYGKIDLKPMEYLSRNLTLRITYASPQVSEHWRKLVPHQRVRIWTVDAEVMKGWTQQTQAGLDPASQDKLWKWVRDNVDYRVRSRMI